MVDIDERVVQMKFDSSDFEKNTKSTFSILDKLHEKLSFKDAVDQDSINAITDNVQKMADKAYTIVDRTIDKIKDNIANKLVNFLQQNTIGQVQAGWSKYADMTTSVATLKSQGYAMDKITNQLERLNYFTDETSYNFTDMVREIGKFTASGQSLEDATTAMMGIAEWAALSGKNANEASRAMYQLSQALGAGQMRLQDYKSVQNLNMDTIEFRKNAIEAAIAVGTLKDNLDGTYTSLLNNKVTFSIQNFTESLTQGKWFNSQVMMNTYKKYSAAVDEIRAIVNEEQFTNVDNVTSYFETTADAIRAVKENNELLTERFKKKNAKLTNDQIDEYLKRWKKVEKVTAETVQNYADINKLTTEEAKKEMEGNYTQYLKEYAEVFQGTEEQAVAAMEDWHTYVSSYGIKAFSASQEAKTFAEAIESAKDAASTVWVGIYQDIFGDYEEAKEIWTDLANALYEIFVTRLSNIKSIFDYWKTGYEKDKKQEIDSLKKELGSLRNKSYLTEYEQNRMNAINKQINEMEARMEAGLYNGRRLLFQGLYAFGGGLKEALLFFRKAWDGLFGVNESGKKLLSFSEKLRINGFQFYTMIQHLGEKTDFFRNIAQGIKNILSPFKALVEIIKSVIGQFLPQGETAENMLVRLSEAFKNLTAKLVPSRETIQKIARILRGVVAVFKMIAKIAYAVWVTVLKPVLSVIFDTIGAIVGAIADVVANIADAFFEFEEGTDGMEELAAIGEKVKDVLGAILQVIVGIVSQIIKFLAPAFNFLKNTIGAVVGKIKNLITGGDGNVLENIANGFKDIGDRAKNAWKQSESLADIFNKYKGGSGIVNFLQMLGEMFTNLIEKIGRTILAILGLDDEVAKSHIGGAIESAKDIIVQAFAIIKWLYTNIIKPTFQLLFEGVSAGLKEVGEAFRSGDFEYFLTAIKNLFKTLSTLEIFKLLNMVRKLFGAGGLLKVFRNGAKALQGIYKYFSAKATNERAGALLKMALALTIVVATMTALTFLPQDNLEKLGGLLMHAGIAMVAMMAGVVAMGAVLRLLHNPLQTVVSLFVSMTVTMLTTIAVIFIMKKAFENLWEEVKVGENADGTAKTEEVFNFKKLGGLILGALTPILAVFGTLLIVTAIAKKLGAGAALKNFAVAIMAIGVSVAALALGLNLMVDFITQTKPEQAVGAILAMVALIAVMTIAGIAMSKFMNTAGTWKSGLGAAIAMAGMVLAISLVVIPCLDDMVMHRDKFPQYVEALGIFALTMLSISASFFLMTVGTKNGFHILMAGIVFNSVTKVVRNFIMPMLQELQGVDFNKAKWGILSIGLLALAIGGAIRLVIDGIANIITAISKINWKSWVAIIGSTGLMVGLLIAMTNIFEMAGVKLSLTSILAPLGIVTGICIAFGLFVKSVSKTLGSGDKTVGNVIKIFKNILAMFAVISGSIVLMIAATGWLMNGDAISTIALIGTFAVSIIAVIITICVSFSKLVKSLTNTLHGVDNSKFTKIKTLLGLMLGFVGMIMTLFIGAVVGVGLTYGGNPLGSIVPFVAMLLATTIGMYAIKEVLVDLFDSIVMITKDLKPTQFKNALEVVKTMLILALAITVAIGSSIVLIGATYGSGYAWQSIIASIGILITVLGTLNGMVKVFKETTKIVSDVTYTKDVHKRVQAIMITMAAIISVMTIVVGATASAMGERIGYTIANALIIIGSILVLLWGITKAYKEIIPLLQFDREMTNKDIVAMVTIFVSMFIVISELTGLVKKMSEYDLASWETGLAFALGAAAIMWSLGNAFQKIIFAFQTMIAGISGGLNGNAMVTLLIIFGGLSLVTIALGILVHNMSALTGVEWTTAIASMAGLALVIYTLSLLAKALQTFTVGNMGTMFFTQALQVAGGILAISAALAAFAGAAYLIKKVFGIGEDIDEGMAEGIKSNSGVVEDAVEKYLVDDPNKKIEKGDKINSPSKLYRNYGKFIDLGLAQGIKQNRKFVTTAATGLAVVTNDSFCDELGIASPSKVFYENGRFVVRGFINGMNDESNKNKQAGADMASGFGDAMDKVIEDSKGKFAGLWSDLGMDEDIKKAMEEGTSGLAGIFEDSIFGETGEALTEAEEKRLGELQEELNHYGNDRNRMATYALEHYNELLALEAKKNAAGKNKLTSSLGSAFEDAFGGALGSSSLNNLLDGKLGDIGSKISGFFGGDDLIGSITSAFTGDSSSGKKGVIDRVTEAIDSKFGTNLSGEGGLGKTISDLADNSDIQSAASKLGGQLGDSIANALKDAVASSTAIFYIAKLRHKLGLDSDEEYFNYLDVYDIGYKDKDFYEEYKAKLYANPIWDEAGGDAEKFVELLNEENKDVLLALYNQASDKEREIQELNKRYGTGTKDDKYYAELEKINQKYGRWGGIGTTALYDKAIKGRMWFDQMYESDEWIEKTLFEPFNNWLKQNNLYVDDQSSWNYLYLGFQDDYLSDHLGNLTFDMDQYDDFVKLIKTGQLNVNPLISDMEDIQIHNKNVEDSINTLLTENGFEEEDFNEEQINAIKTKVGELDNFKFDSFGKLRMIDPENKESVNDVIEILKEIATNGLKVSEDSKATNVETKTVEELARAAGGIDKLTKLNEDARGGNASASQELNRLTNNLGYTGLMSSIESRYGVLQTFMKNATAADYTNGNYNKWFNEAKYYEDAYGLGKARSDGVADGTIEESEKRANEVSTKTTVQAQKDVKTLDKTNSPSKVYYELGQFRVEGLMNGMMDAMPMLEKATLGALDNLNDESRLALATMAASIDDDTIQPTITPIYDDSVFNAGISDLNKSFSITNAAAETTKRSFPDTTMNYNGALLALSNQVNALTGVVNQFMSMVAEGDIVNVNVTGEVDTNNLYELVVNTNREKFKQTGKNKLMSY